MTRRARAFLACWLVSLLVAPSLATARPRFGIQAGANFSTLRYDETFQTFTSTGWASSFTGGVELEKPLKERSSLRSGLRYVCYTNRVEFDTGPGPAREYGVFDIAQHYIALPVLLALRPFPSPRVILTAGPEVAYLVAGKRRIESHLADGSTRSANEDITSTLLRANFTLDAGLEMEIPVGGGAIAPGIRYTHGIVGTANTNYLFSNWKTQGVEALLAYRW
jgi:hypothetical protein